MKPTEMNRSADISYHGLPELDMEALDKVAGGTAVEYSVQLALAIVECISKIRA